MQGMRLVGLDRVPLVDAEARIATVNDKPANRRGAFLATNFTLVIRTDQAGASEVETRRTAQLYRAFGRVRLRKSMKGQAQVSLGVSAACKIHSRHRESSDRVDRGRNLTLLDVLKEKHDYAIT